MAMALVECIAHHAHHGRQCHNHNVRHAITCRQVQWCMPSATKMECHKILGGIGMLQRHGAASSCMALGRQRTVPCQGHLNSRLPRAMSPKWHGIKYRVAFPSTRCHLAACIVQAIRVHCRPICLQQQCSPWAALVSVPPMWCEGHGIGDTDGPSGQVLLCGGTILCRQWHWVVNNMCRQAGNEYESAAWESANCRSSVPCYSACLSAMCAPSTIHPSIYPNIHYHVLPVPQ